MDEKWFRAINKIKTRRRLRKGVDEELPARKIPSKEHIPQIMFLTVIGVPQDSPDGSVFSNGKIGIWPLAERVPAENSSKNRAAGTLEVKPVNVTAEYFFEVMTRPGGVLEMVRKVSSRNFCSTQQPPPDFAALLQIEDAMDESGHSYRIPYSLRRRQ